MAALYMRLRASLAIEGLPCNSSPMHNARLAFANWALNSPGTFQR